MKVTEIKETVCSCDKCKSMCLRAPCAGTISEIQALIEAGFVTRLMLKGTTYSTITDDVYEVKKLDILMPAIKGREGDFVDMAHIGGECTFLDEEGLCELHDIGLKPIEGRAATCGTDKRSGKLAGDVARMNWDNTEGNQIGIDWLDRKL